MSGHVRDMSLGDAGENERRARFERLYVELHPAVSSYVLRRVPETVESGDIVAEVFTVVWRRMADLPAAPEDRLWVFGIARRCVSDATRSFTRRDRLYARIAGEGSREHSANAGGDPDVALTVRDAIAALPSGEAEALRLVAWDGLSHEDAARVLECSANAVAIRVHRARKRLERLLSTEPARRTDLQRTADGGG